MKAERKTIQNNNQSEKGAALVTVLMVSVLLGVACVALLSAVGASSKNSTDVLSETKAYYAAESGLQATINVMRNDSTVNYTYAAANPTLAAKLPYNYPAGAPTRAVIGEPANTYDPKSGTAYSIVVSDPDNSAAPVTFNTSGTFSLYTGGAIYDQGKKLCIPDCPSVNPPSPRTEITFTNAPSTIHSYMNNPSLGSFNITKVGGGVAIARQIDFRIDYRLTIPRVETVSILGHIDPSSAANPVVVNFTSQNYQLIGSTIELCSTSTSPMNTLGDRCPTVSFSLTSASQSATLYADITPVAPYRLKVAATGYGPNGAKKQLEGIIQKDLFNGVGAGAATTMIGTNVTPPGGLPFLFVPGNSNGVTYSGGNCNVAPGCVPSFGLTDPQNLNYIQNNPPRNGTMTPPPAMLDANNTPGWQQSPASLDTLVRQLRTAAQNSSRYFVSPGSNLSNPGNFAAGTGITFCEGSCDVGGSGGGILVVTGKLTNLGGFSFRGMIIVTGEDGWERTGGGGGTIIGNVIIAPYNRRTYVPENLSSTFLAPRYYISGGGASDIIYGDVTASFDNLSSISDLMVGIAEK